MSGIKDILLDLDDTLIDPVDKLFEEAVPILNYFLDSGYTLYLCSHNCDGEKIVKKLGIHHYFDGFSCGYKKRSIYKLVNLAELPVSRETSVFFDDYSVIVNSCRKAGWNMCMVRPSGISWKDVESVFGKCNKMSEYQWKHNKELRSIRSINQ